MINETATFNATLKLIKMMIMPMMIDYRQVDRYTV